MFLDPCFIHEPCQQSRGCLILSLWLIFKKPRLLHGPTLRNSRVWYRFLGFWLRNLAFSMDHVRKIRGSWLCLFAFCTWISSNRELFRVFSILVRKNEVALCRHKTTEWHCVAIPACYIMISCTLFMSYRVWSAIVLKVLLQTYNPLFLKKLPKNLCTAYR